MKYQFNRMTFEQRNASQLVIRRIIRKRAVLELPGLLHSEAFESKSITFNYAKC